MNLVYAPVMVASLASDVRFCARTPVEHKHVPSKIPARICRGDITSTERVKTERCVVNGARAMIKVCKER
jgi:hypothetical protein